ncbi:hypothetical protein [Leptospira alstonii]|nr:hypothetical protein [Leptospira alstonii]
MNIERNRNEIKSLEIPNFNDHLNRYPGPQQWIRFEKPIDSLL